MDYEKKYKDLVKRLNKAREEKGVYTFNSVLDAVVPELKESEDNIIIKALKSGFKTLEREYNLKGLGGIKFEKILTWLEKQGNKDEEILVLKDQIESLHAAIKAIKETHRIGIEKQGEQKPTDKVHPKFNIGDWIYHDGSGNTFHINKIKNRTYISDEGATISFGRQNDWRLWTIQDAKDGDVLACPNDAGDRDVVFIFKNINNDEGWVFCFCASDANGCFCTNNDYVGNSNSTNISPATKEQRDLLFQKIKEAGYEWDAEKKELKKIVAPIFHIGDRVRYKGHACDGVITEITNTDYICGNAKLPISTQNSLEIVEQKPAWSEEDEKIYQSIMDDTVQENQLDGKQTDWLRDIKHRYFLQSKQEWSEEDLCKIENALFGTYAVDVAIRLLNKIKSLRPQNRWKPSELQIEALAIAIRCGIQLGTWEETALKDLIEQLKKLREE